MLEEQQVGLDLRKTHLKGQVLQGSVGTTLEDKGPADEYSILLTNLERLRKLNSSTTCGSDRNEMADGLQRSYVWLSPEEAEQLVGPAGSFPCDDHGPGYPAMAAEVAEGLAFESSVVGSHVRVSDVAGRTDSRSQPAPGAVHGSPPVGLS